jgi:DNA mismatch repair protein MutS
VPLRPDIGCSVRLLEVRGLFHRYPLLVVLLVAYRLRGYNATAMADRSPMMDQYRRIKAGHKDAVLFFRLGDFYEMFFEDAIEASALLDLTLTQRQGEPMCGVPYHAARSYIARLLRCGKKVAICEQLTEPGKGLVERDVVEVVTPGTTVEEDFLDRGANNYLVAACGRAGRICLAYLDISTGEFRAYSKPDSGGHETAELLHSELFRLAPREILIQQSLLEREGVAQALEEAEGLVANKYPDWSFDAARSAEDIKSRFRVASLKGFGFDDDAPELAAAGAILRYIDETARSAAPHLSPPLRYREDEYVAIDEGTRKNLEIVRNLSDSGVAYSLLAVLDYTRTAPGARLLRQWLLQPLRDRNAAEARLDAVEFLYRDQRLLGALREALGGLRDVERLSSRVAMDKAHAKDLLALRDSIWAMEAARRLLAVALNATPGSPSPLMDGLGAAAGDDSARQASEAAALVDAAIREEPSILLTEGDLIRDGYDPELDRLRELKSNSKRVLEEYIEEERAASGIPSLKVHYNRIIGYYLEVSKGKLDAVPAHFIRRQSLVSGERFTTTRLSELESEMNGATERIIELERRLFLEVREKVKAAVPAILALGRAAAAQDCFASFAWAATARGYSRPTLLDEPILHISEGRHPVVEAHLADGAFVPNGVELDARPTEDAPAFALITGPNMAGKSTFLRQTALIALMAQAGSFVPALDAQIGVVDKIFCRVGAQDNLARGESTFLVEMHETAYILNEATERSLVVMDEVGRGTSTIDGLAIAWAVSERMLNVIRCRTLFATHYHELTAMRHARLRNLSLAVLESGGEIVFLKQIRPGPAESSYGIHVARLAGVPEGVLERARQVQDELARKESALLASARSADQGADISREEERRGAAPRTTMRIAQAGLFSPAELLASEIASLDLDSMTPLEALNRLAAIKKRFQSG